MAPRVLFSTISDFERTKELFGWSRCTQNGTFIRPIVILGFVTPGVFDKPANVPDTHHLFWAFLGHHNEFRRQATERKHKSRAAHELKTLVLMGSSSGSRIPVVYLRYA